MFGDTLRERESVSSNLGNDNKTVKTIVGYSRNASRLTSKDLRGDALRLMNSPLAGRTAGETPESARVEPAEYLTVRERDTMG